MSKCELRDDGMIMYNNQPICYADSEDGHQHFTRDDDGKGMLRGKLTQGIMKKLAISNDEKHQSRWDKIWDDAVSQKYKRSDYEDYWLWNNDFFNAPIDDLIHIADLIGIKEEYNV